MIKELISLRGIFILFLFFYHAWSKYPGDGTMPVVLFFVLGGFGMTLGYHERVIDNNFDYKEYIAKRAIKFYPLHLICLMAAFPFVLSHFSLIQIPIFILNAALLQSWIPIDDVFFSYNAVSWYLSNTFFFSIVFPFIIKLINGRNKNFFVQIIASLCLLYLALLYYLPYNYWHAILYINPMVRLTDFMFGMGLAYIYIVIRKSSRIKNCIKKHYSILEFVVFAFIILLFLENCLFCGTTTNLIAPIYWPFTAVIIILCALLDNNMNTKGFLRSNVFIWVGKLSFLIFLTHQVVIRYIRNVLELLSIQNEFVFVSCCFFVTIIISYYLNHYILSPITQWLTKKTLPSLTARS